MLTQYVTERFRYFVSIWSVKGARYWIFAIVFAISGSLASRALDGWVSWVDLKYQTYVLLQDLRGGQRRVPQTTLVAIGDAEYYGSKLAGRRPLKRDYIASLLLKIRDARPSLIAMDIDFRSPDPASPVSDFDDYAVEDAELFNAVCQVASTTKIVLSKAVGLSNDGRLVAERNIYDGNPACQIPGGDVSSGFLQLPTDLRRVPLSIQLSDGSLADSLALAAARALYRRQYPLSIDVENIPYGEFRRSWEFTRVSASEVLATGAQSKLHDQVVLVYGDWHLVANERGSPVVDTFHTPVGITGGAFVHANLIETLLGTELKFPPPEYVIVLIEGLVAAFLALVFAFPFGLPTKFGILILSGSVLILLAWSFFQIFAVSFDILPVLAAMGLHAVADQVMEWRDAAAAFHASESHSHKV